MPEIKLVLTDDHKIVRDGIRAMLLSNKDIRIIGETGTGRELLELLTKLTPDILVLDLILPDITGIELSKQITRNYPSIKILVLSSEIDEETITSTIKNGAFGYLNKDVSGKEFVEAIYSVYNGENYFGQKVSHIIYKSYIRKVKSPGQPEPVKLTGREREIIQHLSEGLSFKETGDKLCISPRTVENHKNNILEKLGLRNTIELVKYAIKENIIQI
jgi:DNA-binding NarL/FixJ family response regulator